jgi:hypothetical protein
MQPALEAGAQHPDFMREPDMTIWFDLPAEVAAERLATARVPDRSRPSPASSLPPWPQAMPAARGGAAALCPHRRPCQPPRRVAAGGQVLQAKAGCASAGMSMA